MKKFIYKIVNTADNKTALTGIDNEGNEQLICFASFERCKKVLEDIENGKRNTIGCKIIIEKEIDI